MEDTFASLRGGEQRKPKFATVKVPEWNRTVRIRDWDGLDKIMFETEGAFIREKIGHDAAAYLWYARAVLRSIVDDAGNPVFKLPTLPELRSLAADGKLDEGLAIYRKFLAEDGKAIDRLFDAVSSMNAIGQKTEFEIEKN